VDGRCRFRRDAFAGKCDGCQWPLTDAQIAGEGMARDVAQTGSGGDLQIVLTPLGLFSTFFLEASSTYRKRKQKGNFTWSPFKPTLIENLAAANPLHQMSEQLPD
jgi:hypothetical protein